ncbi:phytoene desaturase-like protein [Dinothrombium tinctorium]|uniref:Phytoene desaturase n=1 Tax=Dinothrombium tinctorium TaxID=1965070 RepID=A0A443RCG3_9ACAR|nr:phytoene desaturase-like protein [Dinothrombium tinctorium]RWS12941.1 phytoene desaturase-like protein [Dinothrombium tinctorium]
MNQKAVVIGAGVGGTAVAARLAKQGFEVTVYEKNDFGGGRCSLINKNGHRFDQGPSLYLMPKIFEETFRDLGEDINDHLELLKCESNYKVHFHDGNSIQLTCDLPKMCAEIERFEGEKETTIENFLSFLRECHIHYDHSVRLALKTNFPTLSDLLRPKYLPEVFKMHLYDTVYNRASKYFTSDYMKKAFTFQTMYIGMSPYDAPGAYNLLQATEFLEGIWYPKGGFYQVVKALENIATKKFGAKFVYNCGVKRIEVDADGVATGVTLETGEMIKADVVVCNADLVYAYNKLLPPTNYGDKLGQNCQLTSSSISFYWSMKQKMDQFGVHNIFLAEEYRESFDQIFNDHTLPEDPSFYVNVPNRIDPTAAPPGKDSIIVLVPVGHITDKEKQNFESLVQIARRKVIEIIERCLKIDNFEQYIEDETVNHPLIWSEKFNLWKGSILGLSHNIPQVLYFRPSTRSHLFKRLYFVGASAHPGTGVPVVLCGSKLVADQIAKDRLTSKSDRDSIVKMILVTMFFLLLAVLVSTMF